MRKRAEVLCFSGELDISRYEELLTALLVVRSNARWIVLDLSAVTYVDSVALSALIGAKFRWDQEKRFVATVVTDAGVRRIMRIGNVINKLNVVETIDEAFEALEMLMV
jgi:anti-anti-sigma factor